MEMGRDSTTGIGKLDSGLDVGCKLKESRMTKILGLNN